MVKVKFLKIGTALRAYPPCPKVGDVAPVLKANELLLPSKCLSCEFEFESECCRPEEDGNRPDYYKFMDWGHCGIRGDGTLGILRVHVKYHILEYVIPLKCCTCRHIGYAVMGGLTCNRIQRYKFADKRIDWSGMGNADIDWSEVPLHVLKGLYLVQLSDEYKRRDIVNLPFGFKGDAPPPRIEFVGPFPDSACGTADKIGQDKKHEKDEQ